MRPAVAFTFTTQMSADRDAIAPLMRARAGFFGVEGHRLVFGVVLLGWQIALLVALLRELIEPGVWAAIHFSGCFVLAAWLLRRSNTAAVDSPDFAGLQMIVWSAFAGPFGALVAAALCLRRLSTCSGAEPRCGDVLTTNRYESMRVEREHLALLDQRVRLEGARHVRPLVDVIAESSRSEKLDALAVVYRNYGAELAVVLKRALQDPDASVRVLAATVAAKLHATFSGKIGECQAAVDVTPNLAQSWRNLADARLSYAQSGLLEAQRARMEVALATADLARAVEIDPVEGATGSLLERARGNGCFGTVIELEGQDGR